MKNVTRQVFVYSIVLLTLPMLATHSNNGNHANRNDGSKTPTRGISKRSREKLPLREETVATFLAHAESSAAQDANISGIESDINFINRMENFNAIIAPAQQTQRSNNVGTSAQHEQDHIDELIENVLGGLLRLAPAPAPNFVMPVQPAAINQESMEFLQADDIQFRTPPRAHAEITIPNAPMRKSSAVPTFNATAAARVLAFHNYIYDETSPGS